MIFGSNYSKFIYIFRQRYKYLSFYEHFCTNHRAKSYICTIMDKVAIVILNWNGENSSANICRLWWPTPRHHSRLKTEGAMYQLLLQTTARQTIRWHSSKKTILASVPLCWTATTVSREVTTGPLRRWKQSISSF